MATGGTGGAASLQADAVPYPDNDPPRKKGYQLAIFEKKADQEKFSCGLCSKIVREPVQAECGHRFCQNCQKTIEESVAAGKKVLCKFCKDEGLNDEESTINPAEMFPDRGIKREMANIRCKCPNDMCVWAGPFKEYVKHEEECKFQPILCEKCGEAVSKQKIDQHRNKECPQRIIRCEHCRTEMPYAQKMVHFKDCPKLPEPCNQCSKNVPRDKMKKHKSQDCPNRTVLCPLEGCDTQSQQQGRFHQHVQKDLPKHLAWALTHIQSIEESMAAVMESPAGAGSKIDEINSRLESLERQLQGGASGQGRAAATGGATGGSGGDGGAEASATATGGNAASSDRINAMEFKVNSLEPILSVLHGEMNRCITAIEALESKLQQEVVGAHDFRQKAERFETTINQLSSSLQQQDTKMRELEARMGNLSQDRPDGTLLWKIPNFSKVRQDAMAGTVTNIHSRPFFTGPIGYKMSVRLYPNGDGMGKGTHLSLFFTLMRSNHDALLPWPFKQKVYFMLIDQNYKKHIVDAFRSEPSSSSFQRPTSEMNIATGCPLFMQLNKLSQQGHGYLKDDTLFIRVVVETEGLDDHIKQFDPRNVPISSGPN